jgi:NAD/NADP transhydrogenase alpha subunit
MRIGVPRETAGGERRVALVPEVVRKLSTAESTEVLVERGAGVGAVIPDEAFAEAGGQLVDAGAALGADVVLKVAPPSEDEIAALGSETTYLGFLAPLTFLEFDLGGDLEGQGGYARELTAEQQARQQELMAEAIGKVDVVITTALVPGRRAPILVTEDAVKLMKPGSVIVDLAGEQGGNCALSQPGETVLRHDVKICAPLNVPSSMAEHASQLYARNLQELLKLMTGEDGELSLDFEDEVIAGACITRGGEIVHEGAKQAAGAA